MTEALHRPLDAFEELFWKLEQAVPRLAVLAVELEGPTTQQDWQRAVERLQQDHPILSVTIRQASGQRPRFEHTPGTQLPVRFVEYAQESQIDAELEAELAQSFGNGDVPLARVTVLHHPERSVAIFASHHALLDGKSNLLLAQELVAAAAGQPSTAKFTLGQSISQRLGLPEQPAYASSPDAEQAAPPAAAYRQPRVHRLRLSAEDTSQLLQLGRVTGTSVQALLTAAVALAGKRSGAWSERLVRCVAPVDMRGPLAIGDAPGLYLGVGAGAVPPGGSDDLLETASALAAAFANSREVEQARRQHAGLGGLVAIDWQPDAFWSFYETGPMMHELMLTNYARANFPESFGPLRVQALSTVALAGDRDTQYVAAITHAGRITLTLGSITPIANLLENARELLTQASQPALTPTR